MPLYVLGRFDAYPGLAGLFVSAVYAGSLSTLSSGLNAVAAVIWDDFCVGWLVREKSAKWRETTALRVTRSIGEGKHFRLVYVYEPSYQYDNAYWKKWCHTVRFITSSLR